MPLFLFSVNDLSGLTLLLLSDSCVVLFWNNPTYLNFLQNFQLSDCKSVMFSLGTGVNFKPYLHNADC